MNDLAELPVGRPKSKKAEEPAESRRFGSLVRLSDDVVETARVLAPMKGMSMAELLSDTLKPILEKMLDEEMRKRLGVKK